MKKGTVSYHATGIAISVIGAAISTGLGLLSLIHLLAISTLRFYFNDVIINNEFVYYIGILIASVVVAILFFRMIDREYKDYKLTKAVS
jgi:hypothetical protein